MKPTCTPGPWHVAPAQPGMMLEIRTDADATLVALVGTKGLPNRANAELIATAPDLFSALTDLLEQAERLQENTFALDDPPFTPGVLVNARAALTYAPAPAGHAPGGPEATKETP